MEKVHKAYLESIKTKISEAKISQLAMAAPLESGSSPSKPKAPQAPDVKKSQELKDPPCQMIGLLHALLAVGALRPAIAILTKFPWVVDSNPEIADLLIRVLKFSISGLYDSIVISKERNPSFTQPKPRYGANRTSPPPPRKPSLTLWAPAPPSTATTDFIFFFPDWTEWVPICTDLDDLVDVVEPLMRFVGLHVHRDTLFLAKFLRLGKTHLMTTVSLGEYSRPNYSNPFLRSPWIRIPRSLSESRSTIISFACSGSKSFASTCFPLSL
jgi:THO complex subunit 2